jgi:hypothetical protein
MTYVRQVGEFFPELLVDFRFGSHVTILTPKKSTRSSAIVTINTKTKT